ncbi:battenin-like [Contarinia nasturtii]|uniref:battenin-like n=1 Tax=Contarinia nasturtii TaxID=265458 RepID=UPI0012D3AF7C|nr:battenin-like [Contarinia nasturtii]
MQMLFDKFFKICCAKRIKPNANEINDPAKKSSDKVWRDVLAYWILGLGTEFGYVVMICAASDILHNFGSSTDNRNATDSHKTTVDDDDAASIRQTVCNTPSTGVLLIADIVPSMLMNISLPFLPLVKNFRMMLVIALNVSSFLLIANTDSDFLAIVGVVFTSMALGIGEVTLLSYSAKFNKKVITAWSSGTGSAGIIGSLCWAGLIALGLSPHDVLHLMLIVPAIQAVTFWFLLRSPQKHRQKNDVKTIDITTIESSAADCVEPTLDIKLSGLKAKIKFVPKLVSFIAPMVIVFIFEYICVSGLFEMIYVRNLPFGLKLNSEAQYRWFLVTYQIGVFSARSLGAFLKPRPTWWATVVQFLNFLFFMYTTSMAQASNPWLIFTFVFLLGVVGGLCFVNTFHRLINELPANQHKFSLGMITIAESFGIAVGGSTAILIHNILCGKFVVFK